MLGEAAHLIPYAILAALSPLGLAATITVTRTGRLKAFGFAVGASTPQVSAPAVAGCSGRGPRAEGRAPYSFRRSMRPM